MPCTWSSPRAWGCFYREGAREHRPGVFPTCVGVFLQPAIYPTDHEGLPHVRGGVSGGALPSECRTASSPRAWGCFYPSESDDQEKRVFPTCVGVFLKLDQNQLAAVGLPHVRGGVSHRFVGFDTVTQVFPTCVGVFPNLTTHFCNVVRLPHVRGGVSDEVVFAVLQLLSSPRAWGCFCSARSLRL